VDQAAMQMYGFELQKDVYKRMGGGKSSKDPGRKRATRGLFKMIGSPLRLSDSSLELAAAPLYGQHTDEVLQKLAGYSVEEVKRLREAKVVS